MLVECVEVGNIRLRVDPTDNASGHALSNHDGAATTEPLDRSFFACRYPMFFDGCVFVAIPTDSIVLPKRTRYHAEKILLCTRRLGQCDLCPEDDVDIRI